MLCWESGKGLLLGLGFRVLLEGKHGGDIYSHFYRHRFCCSQMSMGTLAFRA